jgi:hypothetical protein
MMKNILIISTAILSAACGASAAELSPACQAKSNRIQTQIADAQAVGNRQELRGLRSALQANAAHCTDRALAAERDADIHKAELKVRRRERELKNAQAANDPKKIASRQSKLEEAQRSLTEAQSVPAP